MTPRASSVASSSLSKVTWFCWSSRVRSRSAAGWPTADDPRCIRFSASICEEPSRGDRQGGMQGPRLVPPHRSWPPSIRLVGLRIVEEIGRNDVDADEDDIAVGLVLPPVAIVAPLGVGLAGVMHDRHSALAAVLDRLA